MKKILLAQLKIDIGLEQKRKCGNDLARCLEKQKKLQKKVVLHPYPMPITDPTLLIEVSAFLFRVSQHMSSY